MAVEKCNALPTSSDGRKSGGFVREESIDMCIEDLTALKIIPTSLGIGQQ